MSRRIEVKGKILKALHEFVEAMSFDTKYDWSASVAVPLVIMLVAKAHSDYVTEDDVIDLVLRESFFFFDGLPDAEGSFSAAENLVHRDAFISILKKRFEALPIDYTLRIALSRKVLPIAARIRLSDNLHLVTCARLPDSRPASSVKEELSAINPGEHGFLEIKVRGYATTHMSSPATAEAISLAKQAAFNFEAAKLFTRYPGKYDVAATLTTDHTGETQPLRLPQEMQWCIGGLAAIQGRFLQWPYGNSRQEPSSFGY